MTKRTICVAISPRYAKFVDERIRFFRDQSRMEVRFDSKKAFNDYIKKLVKMSKKDKDPALVDLIVELKNIAKFY